MREIRMLRSRRRRLETWHGRDGVTLANERARQQGTQTSTYTGAPVLDPTSNLSSRSDFVLVVAWLLVATLRARGPYPLLALSGEQGSAKSCQKCSRPCDPNVAPVRALSREERELMIAANNGYLLAFDNLSGLPGWISDALCRLASGAVSRSASSIPTMTRFSFKQRARCW